MEKIINVAVLVSGGGTNLQAIIDYAAEGKLESGKIVEIQGTAEGNPFEEKDFENLFNLAKQGVAELISMQKQALGIK